MDKNVNKNKIFMDFYLDLYRYDLRHYSVFCDTPVFLLFPVFPDKPDLKTLANFIKYICCFVLNIMI